MCGPWDSTKSLRNLVLSVAAQLHPPDSKDLQETPQPTSMACNLHLGSLREELKPLELKWTFCLFIFFFLFWRDRDQSVTFGKEFRAQQSGPWWISFD